MSTCVNCGHELGVGRFCTNCGHPVGSPAPSVEDDWRTGTAERPATPPPPPPPAMPPPAMPPPATPPTPAAGSVPPSTRFPLFADEVDDDYVAVGPVAPPVEPRDVPTGHRRRTPWGTWVVVAAVLVLVAGLGAWLLTRDDGDGTSASDDGRGRPTHSASHSPSPSPSDPPSSQKPAAPGDVTADSTVEVPATAPANQDVEGNPVDYVGANMLDGDPATCWRMPGDGAGREITITLPGETRLRSVGLVNGYAKTAQDSSGRELDWYHGNRRVLSVEWVFDDGTTLPQELEDTPEMQSVDVDVTTTTITLRLVAVSGPGTGRASRDNTAISDLSLVSG